MKETLRASQRMETQAFKGLKTSNKFRPRSSFISDPTPSEPNRAVRAIRVEESKSSGSDLESGGSDMDKNMTMFWTIQLDRQGNSDPGDKKDLGDPPRGCMNLAINMKRILASDHKL